MDTSVLIALSLACAPLVAPSTTQAIVATESGRNPFAIGVVAARLEHQPRNRDEALTTARALKASGHNFSVGLAQINVPNLSRLGMTLEDGFDSCTNLAAMQRVLIACQARSREADVQRTLRRALSCYYSGNDATGFRDGYVARVVAASLLATRAPP